MHIFALDDCSSMILVGQHFQLCWESKDPPKIKDQKTTQVSLPNHQYLFCTARDLSTIQWGPTKEISLTEIVFYGPNQVTN